MTRVTVCAVALVAAAGCASGGGPTLTVVTFEASTGRVAIRAEIADTLEERARGLMARPSLPEDRGMLFLFGDAPQARVFHMLNTLVPLDLISIRDGRVVGVQRMDPCEDPATCTPQTTTPVADAAVEVNAGTAARAGIDVGTLVSSPLID